MSPPKNVPLINLFYFPFSFADGETEDGEKPKAKVNIVESTGEDANVVTNISNVTNAVVGRVGNMFGKSIGGLSTKFGGGNWF